MSGVVRDLYRYHHWPDRKDYWTRSVRNDAFQMSPRRGGDEELHGIFGRTGEYVGYDNKINYKNRELIRYHHWPIRRNWQNRFESKEIPTAMKPSQRALSPLLERKKQKAYSLQTRPKSERMEYDFMRANNLTTTTAPFATNHTPQIGIKIIGSKRVPVIENLNTIEDRQNSPGGYGPRVPPIQNIAENPTKIDPRLLAEGTKGYFSAQRPGSNNIEYGEDNFSSNLHGKPTFANRTRPDSKTLSPYNNLPPIRANRNKNQMSTVFESEPWIRRGESPKLANDTEYKYSYLDRPLSDRPLNGYHSENNFKMNFQSDAHFMPPRKAQSDNGNYGASGEREFLLQRYLPTDRYDTYKLPSDSAMFSAADEDLLVKIIGDELSHIQPDRLYNAYIEATKFDKQFMGWCSFDRVNQSLLSQNAAPHPDTLRLIASMFIDPSIPGQVNYEKILKFIEYAMKRNYPDLFTKTQDGYGNSKYYNSSQQNNSSLHGLEPFKEKETAKLLRMVHDALNETGYRLDIERLYRDFQSVDNKRETLSKAQISDVLYQNRVPLQDSLLDHILHKFQQSNGQYNWQQFLSFLEKVQSVQTGLPIPQSKRPLEYAKQYPPPHDSWPRAKESPRESPPPSNRNGYDSNDYRDPPLTERERRMLEKLRKTEEAINGLKHRYKGYNSYREDPQTERERRILEKMRKTEDEIYDIKHKNKDRSPSPVHYHESETERERRVKEKINQIEDEIYELKFKDQESQPQNGIDKENKEKRILDQISKTRNTIDDIKITNQIMREGMEVSEKGYNWSDKLLKLSGQLYAIDEQRGKSEGLIPYQVMIDKTMEFNKYAHMDIPYDVIVRLAQEYKNQRDQVDIFKFLDHLGNRYRWYKA
ncbi:uncharacterized protein LOC127726190 isoform X4 [Mytilus californianus]|uniref:uncharacterized protein LOC127726190 isoform X4 n=1 Tax=Mytilus californianus TaxID=6549 RepID=UPI002247DEF3|nr:uncharacterized protein LOC127726190 isoform X4 [Mytilus californianus]